MASERWFLAGLVTTLLACGEAGGEKDHTAKSPKPAPPAADAAPSEDAAAPPEADAAPPEDAAAPPEADAAPPQPEEPPADTSFEIDLPPSAARPNPSRVAGDDVEYLMTDAELVRVAGDRLYVLSRNSGLTVIDMSDPSALRILGRYRALSGEPFELHLRADVAILLFNALPHSRESDGWTPPSKVVALDIGDPAAIALLAERELPGELMFAHVASDALYVVNREDGRCWWCTVDRPQSVVRSIDLHEARQLREVDQLRFADPNARAGYALVASASAQRIYVAGLNDTPNAASEGVVQLIDVSDPNGDLVQGARIEVRGRILQSEHLGEHDGVLRVLSSPRADSHGFAPPPRLQTFQIVSSSELHPLGQFEFSNRAGVSRAALDATRAYVVQNPASTVVLIDFSNPAHPVEAGVLSLPGGVEHLEARGNRLLVLDAREAGYALSWFNVEDLRTPPKLLSSVAFERGGDDLARVARLFEVSGDPNLIVVPSSDVDIATSHETCFDTPVHEPGLQLVELAGDSVRLAGKLWAGPSTRRVLAHRDHLLGVSDVEVTSFGIRDRAKPALASKLTLARSWSHAFQMDGGRIMRANDLSRAGIELPVLEFVAAEHAEELDQPVTPVTLSGLSECRAADFLDVHGSGSKAFVEGWFWDETSETWGSMFIALDAAASTPRVTARYTFGQENWNTYAGGGPFGPLWGNVWAEDFVARLEWTGQEGNTQTRLRVIDLRDSQAMQGVTVHLPSSPRVYEALLRDGSMLMASRIDTNQVSGRTQVYAQRIDLADPSAPEVSPAIKVPGAVIYYDHEQARALTLAIERKQIDGVSADECPAKFASHELSNEGKCVMYSQRLHLVRFSESEAFVEDTVELDPKEWVTATSTGDGVAFVALGRGGYFWRFGANPPACDEPCEREPVELLSIGGFAGNKLEVGRLTLQDIVANGGANGWGPVQLRAAGKRVLLVRDNYAAVVDAADIRAPKLERVEKLSGFVREIDIRNDRALLTLDDAGLQSFEL